MWIVFPPAKLIAFMKYALPIFFSTALYDFSNIVYFMTGYVRIPFGLGGAGRLHEKEKDFTNLSLSE